MADLEQLTIKKWMVLERRPKIQHRAAAVDPNQEIGQPFGRGNLDRLDRGVRRDLHPVGPHRHGVADLVRLELAQVHRAGQARWESGRAGVAQGRLGEASQDQSLQLLDAQPLTLLQPLPVVCRGRVLDLRCLCTACRCPLPSHGQEEARS